MGKISLTIADQKGRRGAGNLADRACRCLVSHIAQEAGPYGKPRVRAEIKDPGDRQATTHQDHQVAMTAQYDAILTEQIGRLDGVLVFAGRPFGYQPSDRFASTYLSAEDANGVPLRRAIEELSKLVEMLPSRPEA